MTTFLLFFAIPALCCGLLIARLRNSRLAALLADPPDARKVHFDPVPRLGGVVIALVFGLGLAVWYLLPAGLAPRPSYGLIPASLVVLVVAAVLGFLDDSRIARPRVRHKLAFEFLAAVVVVAVLRQHMGRIAIMNAELPLWVDAVLSVLWVAGVMNAFNIIDGVDGLAGALGLTAVAAYAVFGGLMHAPGLVLFCLLVAGCLAGFLAFNRPPARVFMGDTGSLLLGGLLAVLSLHIATTSTARFTFVMTALCVAVPVIDILVAMARRCLAAHDRGLPPHRCLMSVTVADKNHIHHILLARGHSHGQVVAFLSLFALILASAAVAMSLRPMEWKFPVMLYVSVFAVAVLLRVGYGTRIKRLVLRLADRRHARAVRINAERST
jgi:UDP-GlcNAc:undecaprenyl-phosphate/decaprenyl-phosphate GlcNAc-1-phosphate transferase